MKWRRVIGVSGIAAACVAFGWALGASHATPTRSMGAEGTATKGPPSRPAMHLPAGPIDWVAIGGGADPVSNEISLEQDLALVRKDLPGPGVVLFAAGAIGRTVQVTDETVSRGDPLRRLLGELLDPRERDVRYQPTRITPDGPTTLPAVKRALRAALTRGPTPLLLWVATHGEQGDAAKDNLVDLWGGWTMSAAELANMLDAAHGARPVRLVMTSCFSGGFADVIWRGADMGNPPAGGVRCGLFASTWDQEASGCDPDPDRREQQGYALYFLHALHGEDRDGRPLPRSQIDFDGDGRISLLDAHTRVRIAARSIDVPTTTSERWLEAVAPVPDEDGGDPPPEADVPLPDEQAVIAQLGARLHLGTEKAARNRLDTLKTSLGMADEGVSDANDDENDAWSALRIALLERWPLLDDPWDPRFDTTVAQSRDAILAQLESSPEARRWHEAQAEVQRRSDADDQIRLDTAQVQRLVRAWDTRVEARRLKAAGGADWQRFEELRACERGAP